MNFQYLKCAKKARKGLDFYFLAFVGRFVLAEEPADYKYPPLRIIYDFLPNCDDNHIYKFLEFCSKKG